MMLYGRSSLPAGTPPGSVRGSSPRSVSHARLPGALCGPLPVSALLLAAAALPAPVALAAPLPAPSYESVRGIVLSTHTGGQEWGSDGIVPALRAMKELGAGWVAIHPYAGIGGDGTVWWDEIDAAAPPSWLTRPIAEAHALGLKILITPHLAYWGSPFHYRGEITFQTPEQWQRFWEGYRAWIAALASACRGADGFCVGSELDRMIDQPQQWRALIAQVRAVTPAALTYASNWTDYERVGFWDALDVIGIQAYFPLLEEAGAGGSVERMTDAQLQDALAHGWQQVLARLRPFAIAHDRPIVFTELGYNQSFAAPLRPWEYHADGAPAERIQLACMRTALEAIAGEPWVLGAFLWKWFPEPHPVGRNFQLATPAMKQVIAHVWSAPAGAH
jgi:sugar phosphate isomerase/epimerase